MESVHYAYPFQRVIRLSPASPRFSGKFSFLPIVSLEQAVVLSIVNWVVSSNNYVLRLHCILGGHLYIFNFSVSESIRK